MSFLIRLTASFKKDIKRHLKSGKDLEKLLFIVMELAEGRKLPDQYKDHPFNCDFIGNRDCNIEPDWVLLYAIEDNELILYRTGRYAQLF